MLPFVLSIADAVSHTLFRVLPYLVGMGILFAVLSYWSPAKNGRPWWHKRGLSTDILYWMVVPLFNRFGRIGITILISVYLLGINTADGLVKFFEHGHGVLSRLPFWVQFAIYLFGSEFCLYWIHRAFHGKALWRYHAVHHASEDVEWISASRFHPVNLLFGTVLIDVIALMAGITPDIFLIMGPIDTISSAFVHANLDWTLGPFKYVLAGPVFHRWHHTVEHGDKNFAGTFSFFDVMFGTFYMPEGALPENFGLDGEEMPEGLGMQLLYPVMP